MIELSVLHEDRNLARRNWGYMRRHAGGPQLSATSQQTVVMVLSFMSCLCCKMLCKDMSHDFLISNLVDLSCHDCSRDWTCPGLVRDQSPVHCKIGSVHGLVLFCFLQLSSWVSTSRAEDLDRNSCPKQDARCRASDGVIMALRPRRQLGVSLTVV